MGATEITPHLKNFQITFFSSLFLPRFLENVFTVGVFSCPGFDAGEAPVTVISFPVSPKQTTQHRTEELRLPQAHLQAHDFSLIHNQDYADSLRARKEGYGFSRILSMGHNLAEDGNSKWDTQSAELSSEATPIVLSATRFCC